MKEKRAQAQIITTVLIILLVLAAIVIVWQVIRSTVEEGAEEVETQSGCMGVTMEITNAVAAGTSITVRRGPGSTDTTVTGYKVFINGAEDANGEKSVNLGPLDTDSYTLTSPLSSTDEVEVAPIIGDTVCAASGRATVA